MVYTYTTTYYSSLHDSILTLCKSILPFKSKRLPSGDRNLEKLQSDNLKWQQDSFHQMLNLMGLQKEGILADDAVSAFRVYLLETLIASPSRIEHPKILRDKLTFLQELVYAKCISQDEYHASKRPLLQRLAVQGAEIEVRDVIVGRADNLVQESSDKEGLVIDFKDENWLLKESSSLKTKSKHDSALKQMKGAVSVFSSTSPYKLGASKELKSVCSSAMREVYSSTENPFWNVQLKEKERETKKSASGKKTRKPFRTLFIREKQEDVSGNVFKSRKQSNSSKRKDTEDETAPLPLNDRLDGEGYLLLRQPEFSPSVKVSETKQKLQQAPSYSLVSAPEKETRIHIGEMDKHSISTQWTTFNDDNENEHPSISTQWTTFNDEDENCHPNLFDSRDKYFKPKKQNSTHLIEGIPFKNQQTIRITKNIQTNPFASAEDDTNKTSTYCQDYNPFWTSTIVS